MTKEDGVWHSESNEVAYPGQRFQLRQEKILHEIQSEYQHIKVFKHKKFGNVLLIDGCVQATTFDEFLYQEMLTFLPLCSVASPENVLIIGGGDGGIAREALKDTRVSNITVVDIDDEVLNASMNFMGSMGSALEDSRVEICICNAVEYINNCNKMYDVIIIDLTDDPIDCPANHDIFGKNFYRTLRSKIKHGGVIAQQTYSPFSNNKLLKSEVDIFRNAADELCYGFVPVPSFPNGNIGILFGRVKKEPDQEKGGYPSLSSPVHRISSTQARKMDLRCYYEKYHEACCTLPLQFGEWFYGL